MVAPPTGIETTTGLAELATVTAAAAAGGDDLLQSLLLSATIWDWFEVEDCTIWSPFIGLTDGGKDLAQRSLLLRWRLLELPLLLLHTESPSRKKAARCCCGCCGAIVAVAVLGKERFSTSCVLGVLYTLR